MFERYMHIERLDSEEVDGIFNGTVLVFPKIDGTNSSVYLDEEGNHKCASRNREITVDNDNDGFCEWALQQEYIWKFLEKHPTWHIFGEWLNSNHVFKYPLKYHKNLYVFDVYDMDSHRYLDYMDWNEELTSAGFTVIPLQSMIVDGNEELAKSETDKNHYILDSDALAGEGVVLKNPHFINPFGRQCYAKIVRKEFKAMQFKHHLGTNVIGDAPVEKKLVEKLLDTDWVVHEYAKYVSINGEPNIKETAKFLGITYHEFMIDNFHKIINIPDPIRFREVNKWFSTILKADYLDMTGSKIKLKV